MRRIHSYDGLVQFYVRRRRNSVLAVRWITDLCSGKPVVFHHIPKCAGTSVARALRLRYFCSQAGIPSGPSYRAARALGADVEEFRQQMLMHHLYNGVRCVAAHVRYSDVVYREFHETYNFMTILRDPVKRFVSHYYWDLNGIEDWARITCPIEEYVETQEARCMGQTMLNFLTSNGSVGSAQHNLHNFKIVGFVENMPSLVRQIQDTLGVGLWTRHQNKKGGPPFPRKVMLRIEELCAPDIAIYEYAKHWFWRD